VNYLKTLLVWPHQDTTILHLLLYLHGSVQLQPTFLQKPFQKYAIFFAKYIKSTKWLRRYCREWDL